MLMFIMMMVAMNSTCVLAFVAISVVNTCSSERIGPEREYNETKRESERQRQKVMQKYC